MMTNLESEVRKDQYLKTSILHKAGHLSVSVVIQFLNQAKENQLLIKKDHQKENPVKLIKD